MQQRATSCATKVAEVILDAATVAAIRDWRQDNEYPQGGYVSYQFSPFESWGGLRGTFSTDSWKRRSPSGSIGCSSSPERSWASCCCWHPNPQGRRRARGSRARLARRGYALLAASTLRAVYSIYQSLDLGRPALHERHILEAAGIVAGLLGLGGGTAMRTATESAARGEALAGRSLIQFQVGRGAIYTAALLDGGTFVYMGAGALAGVRRGLAEDASGDEQAALLRVIGQLAMQGILIVGSNRDLFRATAAVGTGPPGLAGLLGDGGPVRIDPEHRARIEAELQALGHEIDVSALSDLDVLTRLQDAQNTAVRPPHDVVESADGTPTPPPHLEPAVPPTPERSLRELRTRVADPASATSGRSCRASRFSSAS